jgi:hypothetical protein
MKTKNMEAFYSMETLSIDESVSTNGGLIFTVVGLLIAGFALGYSIGKDAAERSRR